MGPAGGELYSQVHFGGSHSGPGGIRSAWDYRVPTGAGCLEFISSG